MSLAQGIAEANTRYQVAERWILEPLTYFDDIEMMPIEWLGKKYSDEEVRRILTQAAQNYIG